MTGGAPVDASGRRRFVVERRLGAGAMGVVYAALDRTRGAHVALKTLRHADADALYTLKREFRALADVTHPNLVQLHELHAERDGDLAAGGGRGSATPTAGRLVVGRAGEPSGERAGDRDGDRGGDRDGDGGLRWFFTMELVDGVDFVTWVGRDEARLRAALRQLADGVAALHQAGKLHRDIKPSNALVTREGRVVLLDFGLATDAARSRLFQTLEGPVVGTPAYLAPEQAQGAPVSAAADWYGVGAVLYEALTGELPFSGGLLEILAAKQAREPAPPRALRPDVPGDLDELCVALLRRRPQDRPTGREVLRRLAVQPAGAAAADAVPREAVPPELARTAPHELLVGREGQLAALAAGFERSRAGEAVVAFVHGASGMGKSMLVQRFLEGLVERGDAVVLLGRCYERELVPYRALDSLVDALARHLGALPVLEGEALLPRDTWALARLFPVLRRADAVAKAPRRGREATDPQEIRGRAFAALRELLGRIADRRPLVLAIDDIQWGDADSASALAHVLRAPEPPSLLLLACYRDEDRAGSACLEALAADTVVRDAPALRAAARVEVGPLDAAAARRLALALVGDETPGADDLARAVAAESGGSPFIVHELAGHVRTAAEAGVLAPGAAVAGLADVLRARIARLAAPPRRLLEALAVAGRPLDLDVAAAVGGLGAEGRAALAALRAAHLVRARGDEVGLEVVHDRVRQAVLDGLAPGEARTLHGALARVLEARAGVDPEVLAFHWLGAADTARAGEYAAVAAERADEALAFERAVRLWRWALALVPAPGDDASRWQGRLGDALANLGRGREAADAYLAALPGASTARALELRRRAAEQLLRTGHLAEGLAALASVLDAVGARLAPTPRRALASLLWRRARTRLRGLGFRRRDASEIAPSELTRVDTFWSASTSLGIIDNVRATDFQTRHLLLALDLGEPSRIARALAAEAAYSSLAGARGRRRTARLIAVAEDIAAGVEQPFVHGWATLAAGMAAYMEGRRRDALALCEGAEATFRGCVGVTWEVGSARLFGLWSLFYLGELAELGRRLPAHLTEAEERGDLYAATNFRTGILNAAWLLAGDPDRARAELDAAMRDWPREGFHSQHFWDLLAAPHIDLYRGDAAGAWGRLEAGWPALRRSLILRIETARIESHGLRARCALALAQTRSGSAREALRRAAIGDAARIQAERSPWAAPIAALLRAGAAALAGDEAGAVDRLTAASRGFEATGMAFHAALARHRRGTLQGGDAGRVAVTAADTFLAGQRVPDPARALAVWAPGFDG